MEFLGRPAEINFWQDLDFFLLRMVRVAREGRIAKYVAIPLSFLSYTLSKLA